MKILTGNSWLSRKGSNFLQEIIISWVEMLSSRWKIKQPTKIASFGFILLLNLQPPPNNFPPSNLSHQISMDWKVQLLFTQNHKVNYYSRLTTRVVYLPYSSLLPSATKLRRLCFTGVCLSTGGVPDPGGCLVPVGGLPGPGGAWSWGMHGPGCMVLGGVHGPGGTGIPTCTEADPPRRDDYCCGRYAFYWSAFLF